MRAALGTDNLMRIACHLIHRHAFHAIALLAILGVASPATLAGEPTAKADAFAALAGQYTATIRPTIQQFCLG